MRNRAIIGTAVLLGGIALATAEEPAAPAAGSEPPAQPAEQAAVPAKPQTVCPVMGGEINKSIYVDYEGKRIYLCCRGCIGAVRKDPAKYIKKLEQDGVTPERVPVAEAETPAR